MIYEWKDKVVLITGAATGIGAEVVKIIVGEGTRHVAVLDIAEGPGIDLQNELNAKYGEDKVKFYKCDVTDEDLLLGYFDEIHAKYGLDVVINNAGIMTDSYKTYKKEIEINVTALVTGTLKAMELMREDKGGKGGTVINISSIVALHQSPLLPIYFATKSAVLQFSNCIGKFTAVLETLQTPSQIMTFICQKTMNRRSRKIKVQPTSIARRKYRGNSGGRTQAGRPLGSLALEDQNAKKRSHCFNINNNQPCAKKH